MLRLLGSGMIAAVSLLYAWRKAGALRGRVRQLEVVQAALRKLKNRILPCREPLEEALRILGEEDVLLQRIWEQLDTGAENAWRRTISRMEYLCETDKMLVWALTDPMGQMDWETLCASMDRTEQLLAETLQVARQAAQKEGKLYRTLGMLAAAAALILGI